MVLFEFHQRFKGHVLNKLHISIKSMRSFSYFCIFFVLKGLLEILPEPTWETFSTCLIVLDNLCEVFGCSIITDFMSTVCGFSIAFDC